MVNFCNDCIPGCTKQPHIKSSPWMYYDGCDHLHILQYTPRASAAYSFPSWWEWPRERNRETRRNYFLSSSPCSSHFFSSPPSHPLPLFSPPILAPYQPQLPTHTSSLTIFKENRMHKNVSIRNMHSYLSTPSHKLGTQLYFRVTSCMSY